MINIQSIEKIVGIEMPRDMGETRAGEYAAIYANYDKAKKLLDWQPQKTLEESIRNSKVWFEDNPNGY